METQRLQVTEKGIKHSLLSACWHLLRVVIKGHVGVLVVASFFVFNTAHAIVTTVTVSPASISIPANGAATIKVKWNVRETSGTTAPSLMASSPSAVLQINGNTVATLGGVLNSSPMAFSALQVRNLSFPETLRISATLARRIAESPAGSVTLLRGFSDAQNPIVGGSVVPAIGVLPLSSGANNAGTLMVRRIDLAFEGGARTDVLQKNEQLRAIADIAFRSNGFLKGEWRLVDPSASQGNSGGRVLQVVRKNLVSSGQGRTRLVSPSLPTRQVGLHMLAFVIEEQGEELEIPVIRYFVTHETDSLMATHVSTINVLSPGNGLSLSTGTVFSWEAVGGAQAYQVELFNRGDEAPIVGKLVPATNQKLLLSSFSIEQLMAGYEYAWRVRAMNDKGKVVAESRFQRLRLSD